MIGLVGTVSAEHLDYYAYGDSVTNATIGAGLPANGSATYILQMRDLFEPEASVDYFKFGRGWNTSYAYDNLSRVLNNESKINIFIVMFGINDLGVNSPAYFVAGKLADIYDYSKYNSTRTVIMIQTMIPTNPKRIWTTQENQTKYILEIEKRLDEYGIKYVKAYDFIDLVPGNGYPDGVNLSYMAGGGGHPNVEGHKAIAIGLYDALKGEPPIQSPSTIFLFRLILHRIRI